MSPIAQNLRDVRARIARACDVARRSPETVTLVAISKRHPVSAIREAFAHGQRDFGENYVQELMAKRAEVGDELPLRWHFVGHLQRNKAKEVVAAGAQVHTVDSLRVAEELDRRAKLLGVRVRVLLQVNVAGEVQKSGCEPSILAGLVHDVRQLSALDLVGLMTLPPVSETPEGARPFFRRLRELGAAHRLAEFSMGMSPDLEIALEEGATLVRVGTAIFGERSG